MKARLEMFTLLLCSVLVFTFSTPVRADGPSDTTQANNNLLNTKRIAEIMNEVDPPPANPVTISLEIQNGVVEYFAPAFG